MVHKTSMCLLKAVSEQTVKSSKLGTGRLPDRLPPLPTPRDILKLYRISAQRKLSQNFLLDFRLNNKIVTSSGNVRDCYVCEVGPGPGNITRAIINNGAKEITVVEKDRRFLPALHLLEEACEGRMKIILGDIMDLSLESVFPKELASSWTTACPPFYVIGNLPFNISTPLIIQWLRHCSRQTGPFKYGRTNLTLTFQKEVADRMIALPGSDVRCRLSVMCQYLCNVDNLFTIPGRAFFPKPEVDVSVVKFVPLIKPAITQPFKIVEKIMRVMFHHRQKYCRYNLELLYPKNYPDMVERTLTLTKINPQKRSFEIEMAEFSALCDAYCEICGNDEELLGYDFRAPKKVLKLTEPGNEYSSSDNPNDVNALVN